MQSVMAALSSARDEPLALFFFTEDCRLCKASAPATFRQPRCPGMANPRQKHPQQSPGTAEFRDQKAGFLKQIFKLLNIAYTLPQYLHNAEFEMF